MIEQHTPLASRMTMSPGRSAAREPFIWVI
jgi:hypothetical protein